MKACDGLDGAEDGVKGKDTGDSCLSDAQIQAVEKIGSRVSFGFAPQSGQTSFAPWPILEGADWTGLFAFGSRPKPSNPPEPLKDFGLAVLSDPMVRFMTTRDPHIDPLQFDPTKYQDRLREVSASLAQADLKSER
jgi:hypothetical protein